MKTMSVVAAWLPVVDDRFVETTELSVERLLFSTSGLVGSMAFVKVPSPLLAMVTMLDPPLA